MSSTVRTDLIVFRIVGSEICIATIHGMRDCASMAKLSIFITLLTVPYVRQQNRGNAFLCFHCNTGYPRPTQCLRYMSAHIACLVPVS